MTINVNSGGSWKEAKQVFINQNGAWKPVLEAYVKENGQWKPVFSPKPVVRVDYRYEIEVYGGKGADNSVSRGGLGGYTNFFLYPLTSEKGTTVLTVYASTAANGSSGGSGWGKGGNGAQSLEAPNTSSGGGGSSAVASGSGAYAVCGGGGGASAQTAIPGGPGNGGVGASPNALEVSGTKGADGQTPAGAATGGAGGAGGLGRENGEDTQGSDEDWFPGGAGGAGGGLSGRGDGVEDRAGGGGGGGGGLRTLDGQVDDYRMAFNTITRGSYSGDSGYVSIKLQARLRGSTGAWTTLDTFTYEGTIEPFNPNILPEYNIIGTPTITSPQSGQDLNTRTPTIVSSPYTTLIPSETHKASTWQVSKDPGFGSIVWESVDNTSSKTSITVPANILKNNRYYARVKYISSSGLESKWSPAIDFTCPVAAPIIVFTNPLPATISGQACGNLCFDVKINDTNNDNWTSPSVTTSTTWTVTVVGKQVANETSDYGRDGFYSCTDGLYYSDNGKTMVYTVKVTNPYGSQTISTTGTFSVTRNPNVERTTPEYKDKKANVTNFGKTSISFMMNDNSPNDGWGTLNNGRRYLSIPKGQGRLRFEQPFNAELGITKSDPDSGINCSNGRGTQWNVETRMALYDERYPNNPIETWWNIRSEMNRERTTSQTRVATLDQGNRVFDLDPETSYILIFQAKRTTTTRCTCEGNDFVDCQDINYNKSATAWDLNYFGTTPQNETWIGYTPIGFECDTRPTSSPYEDEENTAFG